MTKKKRVWRGPRLPNAFQKELDGCNSQFKKPSEGDDDIDSDYTVDVYEYEEAIPEEELKKNKRFDTVKNYQYELPEDFEDENVLSSEGEYDEEDYKGKDADGRHVKMLEDITGLPSDAFAGLKKKDAIFSEAYPESEYNPSRDILDGDGLINIQDLVDPLHGKSGFSKLKRNLRRIENKYTTMSVPLPKLDQERLERKAAYEHSKKDITKWEPLVKKNREAPTLYFDTDVNLGFSTIGSIASEFVPRTKFEKKIASLVSHNEVVDAHKNDGARLLELNEISVENLKKQQDRLAKMRSLLFRHEIKSKRIKKIKSRTYHRLLKKDRTKVAEAAVHVDPEAAKELAMKQEFKRAEERMTLKHKNSSRWAKRILIRGLDVQDDGTRAAFAEQLNTHTHLTRKIKSMEESSGSDESSEDDSDDSSTGSDVDKKTRLLIKAKEKTHNLLEEDTELPLSGVLSLPFMVRVLKKRKEAADEEANIALEEYESSLKQLECKSETGDPNQAVSGGRRFFGVTKEPVSGTSEKTKSDNNYGNSDSDNDNVEGEDELNEREKSSSSLRVSDVDPNLLYSEFEINHNSVFKSSEDFMDDPDLKRTYDVAYFSSNSWKKGKVANLNESLDHEEAVNVSHGSNGKSSETLGHLKHDLDIEQNNIDSEMDSGGEMVDGILCSGTKSTYKLPSQAELIHRAFAGDNVEEDFEIEKEKVLNEENPEPEKPVLLPGWGQWTGEQKKKRLPSWMHEEHEDAKKTRKEILEKRKDARLSHVIISEKLDKKAEKLHTKSLPYPYTSKEVFEQSNRMPIGPEFNPVSTIGAFNRPEVVKKAGVIIKPIKFTDINGKERVETRKINERMPRKGTQKATHKKASHRV